MPRFVVERFFPDGLLVPMSDEGAKTVLGIVEHNAEYGVTWVTSYVTEDKAKTFCVYDAPDAEAIRRAADLNDLPVGAVSRVRVLDPYFYF
ncbi:MAG TPA: DUF4242 domain-containing protein [Actinomycetes bacterium]|nr:DUF4242 domain-containing protein [Actinomycetes bacterium]